MGPNNWNSNALAPITEGKLLTAVAGGWVNFKKADGSWSAIDTTLTKDGTGFHMDKAPFTVDFPLFSDGEATFNNNNRYDIFNKTDITAAPLSQKITAFGVSSVAGEPYDIEGIGRFDAAKYPNAYGAGIHLVYYVQHGRAPRLKKLIQFDQKLPVDTEYEFQLKYSGRVEISTNKIPNGRTRKQHRDATEILLDTPLRVPHDKGFYIRAYDEPQKRGIGIKQPLIWDSDGKVEGIELDIRKGVGANTYILTKSIKASFFDGVTYPVFTDTTSTFYPQASGSETTSVDGWTRRFASGSYSTVVSGAGQQGFSSDVKLEMQLNGAYSEGRKIVLAFDTSAIGADNIDSANLSCTIPLINADLINTTGKTVYINISTQTTVTDTDVVAADYNGLGTGLLSSDIDISTLSNGAEFTFALNSSGLDNINGSGISKFGLAFTNMITVTDPLFGAGTSIAIDIGSAERGIDMPTLVVEHSVPPPGEPTPLFLRIYQHLLPNSKAHRI